MLTHITNGTILTPDGWLERGTISFDRGHIVAIHRSLPAGMEGHVVDAEGCYVLPGGVDIHVHGGGGHDFLEGSEEAFRAAVTAHLKHGTTAIYPTLAVASTEVIRQVIATTERVMADGLSPVMGLHLEGPYINPTMAGGQPLQDIRLPDAEEYSSLLSDTHVIKRWDASPELTGAMEFGRYASSHGALVALAHTTADYDRVKQAYEAGYTHATHFYNAMTGVHKKGEFKHEGTIESIYLIDGMSVELVADGIHVPAPIMRLVHKIKGTERVCLVTDAMAAAASEGAMPYDGRVIIEDGVCKLADRSALAGSVATMDRLIRTAVHQAEIPLADAVRMVAQTPARLMGIYDRKGSLEVGKDADIILMNRSLDLQGVWSMGQEVEI